MSSISTIHYHGMSEPPPGVWRQLIDSLDIRAGTGSHALLIGELLSRAGPTVVSFLNAHACNLALRDEGFLQTLLDSDYLLRDGVGVELHMKLRGRDPGYNMNGTDFIPELIRAMPAGSRVALYGSAQPWLGTAAQRCAERGLEVDVLDGFQHDTLYRDRAASTAPELIVLGMGMPKQERVAMAVRAAVGGRKALIVSGGAVIDFMGDRHPRAPRWMQLWRLESLFRLFREPRRLWRRNVGSIGFLGRSVRSLPGDRRPRP